jgi:hypothetical protein
VQNLGTSEVDAQTAQWVGAFANPATLPPSQGIQVASAPIGTVGDTGYFDGSGAYIEPAQLIWADGTTSTLTQGSNGEPVLSETEVRETAQPMLPEDFRRQEIEYRNSTGIQPPQRSLMELVEMPHSPVDSYSAREYRDAAAQYRANMGADFRRDSIYNGLWTRAAALDAAAGGGWGQEVINDITGFATEEGLHAQTGVAIGGALGRGIGSRLGNSVDTVLDAGGKKPDGDVPSIGSGDVSTNRVNTDLTLGDGIVASRVNVRTGDANEKGSGLEYAWKKHGGAWTDNKSAFTISKEELKIALQAPLVVNTPAYRSVTSGNYIRTVDMGRTIGIDAKSGGQPTNFMTVITDSKGNLVNAFPGKTF